MWAKSNRINGKTVVYKLLVVFSLWLSLVSITNAFFTVPNIPYPFVYTPPSTPASIAAPATINSNPVGSWTVSWSAGAGATTYELWESLNESTWARVYTGSGVSKVIAGKAVSGSFRYRVRACNYIQCSPYTSIKTVVATIGIPSTLTVPAGTNTSGNYTISWPAGYSLAPKYLESKESGDWTSILAVGSTTSKAESGKSTGLFDYRMHTKGIFCVFACGYIDIFELPKSANVIRTPLAISTPLITNKTDEFDQEYVLAWSESSETDRYELWRRKASVGASNYGGWSRVSNNSEVRYEEGMTVAGNYQYRARACNYSCSVYSGIITTTVRTNAQPDIAYTGSGDSGISVDTDHSNGTWSNNPLDGVSAYSLPAGVETVGATGGAHDVSQDGSASYTIQIPVPGGRGGLTPELSLAYNSNGGNTELGVGWDIGGLRLIHRCSSNYALHGEVRGIKFDDNDKLCLDGQPLVAIGGTYGKNGATYRTVAEGFAEIKSLHSEGSLDSADSSSTVNAFKVRTKDGKTLWFGNTPDSRLSRSVPTYGCAQTMPIAGVGTICIVASVTETKKTYQWMLSKIEDRFGNKIDFSYENVDSAGEQRIKTVTYNGGLNKVGFEWQDRSDKTRSYFAGSLLQQQKRLKKVVSYSSSAALRSLHLSYSNDGATQYSKLTEVKECAEDTESVCLTPTTFDWSQGDDTYSWDYSNISSYTWRDNKPPMVMDLNGDGFDDLFTPWDGTWKVAYGGTNGFADWTQLSTSPYVSGVDGNYLFPINYDDDPATEILAAHNGKWWVFDHDGNDSATLTATDTGLAHTGHNYQPKLMDVNADGRTDLVYRGSDGNWWYRLMTSAGLSSQQYPTSLSTVGGNSLTYSTTIDYNGDGLQDIMYPYGTYYQVLLGNGHGFTKISSNLAHVDYPRGIKLMDLNGDGLTDALFRNSASKIVYAYNNGAKFGPRITFNDLTVTDSVWRRAKVIDFNTDGKQDLLIGSSVVYTGNDGTVTSKLSSTLGDIPSLSGNIDVVVIDHDGDSLDDFVTLTTGTGTTKRYVHRGQRPDYVHTITNGMGVETKFHYRSLHQGADLESADDFYDPEGLDSYPLQSQIGGSYLVAELEQSDGLGDYHSTTYKYRGGRTHIGGLGSLGFSQLITLNNDTGIRTEASFSQDYANNLQGTTDRVQTIAPNGTTLSDTNNQWEQVKIDPNGNGINGKRYRIELKQTTAVKRDLNGVFMSREVNDYTYDAYNKYGNITNLSSKVYSTASGGSPLRTSSTTNTWVDKPTPWLLGLLTKADTTVTDHSNGQSLRKVVTAQYDELTTGRKKAEQIRNPANNTVLNETRFGENLSGTARIDSFGNLLETAIKGPDFTNRNSRKVFNSTGLKLLQSYDAQSNKTTYTYYGDTEMGSGNGAYPGKVKQVTAPNGLKTDYKYDRFGRTTQTTSAYGTGAAVSSYNRYNWCDSGCRSGAEYVHTSFAQGGVPVHAEVDQLGRTVRKRTLAMDGRELMVDTNFDHLGNAIGVSNPYFAGEVQFWNHIEYDILSRPVATTEPSGRRDTVTYNGLTKTSRIDVTDKNQSKTEYRNALNNLTKVTDNAGTHTTFKYDSLGRQIEVKGPSNKPITIKYNALGHKVEMNDPDKGLWKYTSNGLGQLITQTDAKGSSTCMAYDTLGRMVKRYDSYTGGKATGVGQNAAANQQCAGGGSQETAWTYYNAANTGSNGQLNTVISPDYAEKHYYDSYTRPTRSDTTVKGNTFTVNTTYDSLSRPLIISYPSSSAAHTRLEVQQRYNGLGFNTGTYSKNGSQLYNRVEAVDAMGNITNSYFGNGIRSQRQYAKDTGYLNAIYTVGVDLNDAPQDYAVEFDLVGNLTTRADAQTGFEETYAYDSMNRLRWAYSDYGYGLKTTEVRYDNKGNITYKTGVGHYSYGSAAGSPATRCGANAGPHAVVSISSPKSASYCYDRNGNQVSGDGRAFTYTAFDKPSRITKGGNTNWIDMQYGASRQLTWRKEKTVLNGTTVQNETYLIGGVYERVIHTAGPKAGKVEERHTVGNAIVTYKHNSNGSNRTQETVYTHTDHLGSIAAITDSNGFVKERLSFDAWGKRRQPSTQELLATLNSDPLNFKANPFALQSDYTSKGFTGHQQLDGVGIIHMGGRIYDAELGRFLQADPFVNDRTHTQALNRYTYVENNPLSYTDPSGYFLKKLFKKVGHAISSAWKEAVWKPIKKRLQQIARVKWLSSAISVALNFIPICAGGWCSMLFSAAMTMANGGTFGQVLAGAAIGAIVGNIGDGLGQMIGNAAGIVGNVVDAAKNGWGAYAALSAGHMIAGGILSKAQGGKFIDGVKGAAVAMGLRGVGKAMRGDFKPACERMRCITGSTQISDGESVRSKPAEANPVRGPESVANHRVFGTAEVGGAGVLNSADSASAQATKAVAVASAAAVGVGAATSLTAADVAVVTARAGKSALSQYIKETGVIGRGKQAWKVVRNSLKAMKFSEALDYEAAHLAPKSKIPQAYEPLPTTSQPF